MILCLLSSCIQPLPSSETTKADDTGTPADADADADVDADTDADTDTDTDTDADPVEVPVGNVAAASTGGRYWPAAVSQLDGDAELEILATHPWQASFDPVAWLAIERKSFALTEVASFSPRTLPATGTESCLNGSDSSALAFASAHSADINGDSYDDVAISAESTNGGGIALLYRTSAAPLSDNVEADVVTWCFEGTERFGGQVLLVPDTSAGPALAVLLRGGGRPAGVALYAADTPGPSVDATAPESTASLFLTLHEQGDGSSYGESIGTADLDGNGLSSLLVSAHGDGSDPARVWALDEEAVGHYYELYADVTLLIDGQINADATPDFYAPCYGGPITSGDIDGDGATDVVMGFPFHGQVSVGTAASLSGGANTYAAALPGITGSIDSCFATSLAIVHNDATPSDIAIGAPLEDGAGVVYLVDGVDLSTASLDIAAGDHHTVLLASELSGDFGGALASGDIDLDGLGDLAIAEVAYTGGTTWLLLGSDL